MNVTKCWNSGVKKLFHEPQLDCLIAHGVFSEPFEVTIARTCFEGRHGLAHTVRGKSLPQELDLDLMLELVYDLFQRWLKPPTKSSLLPESADKTFP